MTRARDVANQINRVNSSAADATAITIDSSENVLVGKTSADGGIAGFEARSTGETFATSSGASLYAKRTTGDGDVFVVQGPSGTVGSIGSNSSSIYALSGDTGILLYDFADEILPVGTSANTRDAAISLGRSTTRFKDIYLSGGVFLGGTGAANKLEDYEEGDIDIQNLTFTTSGSATTTTNYQTLRYTKVGQVVSITGNIFLASVTSQNGALKIPLPFTNGTGEKHRTAAGTANVASNTPNFIKVDAGQSFGTLISSSGFSTVTVAAGQTYLVQLTYNT